MQPSNINYAAKPQPSQRNRRTSFGWSCITKDARIELHVHLLSIKNFPTIFTKASNYNRWCAYIWFVLTITCAPIVVQRNNYGSVRALMPVPANAEQVCGIELCDFPFETFGSLFVHLSFRRWKLCQLISRLHFRWLYACDSPKTVRTTNIFRNVLRLSCGEVRTWVSIRNGRATFATIVLPKIEMLDGCGGPKITHLAKMSHFDAKPKRMSFDTILCHFRLTGSIVCVAPHSYTKPHTLRSHCWLLLFI